MPHLRDRLHFSTLMVFMEFCRTRSVSQTAANLGKSKAHVSVQLKTFAEQSGLTLYSRAGGHYYVNEQGLSIGKSIYHLANLNSFAATACNAPDDWQHITIRIPMRYWGGGISQALMHAIGEVRRQYPAIFYYCEFLDDYHDFQYRQRSWLPETRSLGSIDIRYTSAGADISGRWLALDNGHKTRHANWIVPKMPWGIMQTLAQDLETADIPYTYCDADYTQKLAAPLPDGERLLVNELLLTEALRAPHHSEPFPQARRSGLHCLLQGEHPALAAFRDHYIHGFHAENIRLRAWGERISARQWRYFAALAEHKRFSRAADSLCITQPALSKLMSQLENRLGQKLLLREKGGRQLRLSPAGELLHTLGKGIAVALDDLGAQITERRRREKRELHIGILPSVDENSRLLATIMHHLDAWREQYPDIRVRIYEAVHERLVEHLRRLDIQLAIIEAPSPWLEQYPVFAPETLGLVAPAAWFTDAPPPAQLAWSELGDYPLVLPGKNVGIRYLIDRHCRAQNLALLPDIESDSLNLNSRWVAQGRYATILPASAMHSLIERGQAQFIPLMPPLERQLHISHLRHRQPGADEARLLAHFYPGSGS